MVATARPLALLLLAALAAAGCRQPGAADAMANRAGAMGAKRELISTITGDPPNFAQMSNGNLATVVSRHFGRGAKAGALVELYWPNYTADHLWDSYVGVVRDGGKATWAHQLKLVRQALAPDTGRAIAVFEGAGVRLEVEDVVAPAADTHLRRATLTNTDGRPLAGASLANFAFFTIGHLPAGDKAAFEDGVLVQRDGATSVAVAADVAPDAARVGAANLPRTGVFSAYDARHAAEAGDWKGPQAVDANLTGVDAVSRHPLPTLQPGASASVTWAIAVGADPQATRALARKAADAGFAPVAQADADRWSRWLAGTKMPAGLEPQARAVYRRAMIALGQHMAGNGGVIAAPTNMNPPYRFVWPRDGSLIALTLLKAGHRAEAERFFGFAETLQRPDGSFAINYFPDGKRALWDFGPNGNEHDQPGTFAWGVEQVFAATGDRGWAAARWPAVKRACGFLLGQQAPSGLLTTCRDLWELDHDGTWTYSNGAAAAGLLAGAKLADLMGEPAEAQRYRFAAQRMRQAIEDQLVGGPGNWLVRGLRKGKLDTTVEAANLALGASAFGVFDDRHPAMLATGEAVKARLAMPGGGIRRYENDPYYDGQPWPVATSWLATHRLAVGDAAPARAAIKTMTRWAGATESLMLGEQFDEEKRRWASAFPLAWSEAAFVNLALEMER